jgi:adenylate cyclase
LWEQNVLKKLFRPSGFKLGLLLTLLFCLVKLNYLVFAGAHAFRFIENIENSLLDLKFQIRGGPGTPEEKQVFQEKAHVVIAAIDEKSVRMEDLGMFPWPRDKIGMLIRQLNKCGAKVIGFDVVFSEPDASRTAPVVGSIVEKYAQASSRDEAFQKELEEIYARVQGDKILAKVIEDSENVVLGYFFFTNPEEVAKLSDRDKQEIKEGKDSIGFGTIAYTAKSPRTNVGEWFHRALGVRANIPVLTEATERYGFFNQVPDQDRIYRRVPMVFAFDGNVFPSLSLQVLSAYYEQPVELLVNTITKNEHIPGFVGLFIGPLGMPTEEHVEIPVETGGMFRVNYYGGGRTFKHVSAGDIIHGEPQACADVNDKVVLVGATTWGIYDLRPTPFEHSFPGVEIHASAIENVITKDFTSRPIVLQHFEALFILLAGIFLSWVLNRIRLTLGLLVVIGLFLGVLAADSVFLFRSGIQAHIVWPLVHMVVLFMGVAVYRYATEERQKREIRHAFQFYLSGSVIDTMLHDTSKLKLGGERRELTVLFSDIRGFTTISEQMAPEAVTELLNEYLTPMTDLVFKYNGTLDKYMGDAVMAFFGAPVSFADHPRAACRTALGMMEKLRELRADWRVRDMPELDIGIGVNTGPMSVGNMGSADRFDYTVLGDHVNLGSRLEGLNKQFGTHIIVSEFTQAKLGDHFTCRELDAVLVKGKLEPVRIFELLHRGPADPDQDGWIEDFHGALGKYKQREWARAIAGFEKLSEDRVSKMYIQRCMEMQANPPGPEWDGLFKMTTK